MGVALEKIIRISAQTRGQQGLAEMDRMIRRLGPGAEASVVGVLRLNRVLGDMGTIAGGIGLAGLGASLLAFGRNSVQAGDDSLLVARRMATLGDQTGETARMMEFARTAAERFSTGQLETSQAVADLVARLRPLGVSMTDIETTFNGVNKAARLAGLSASDQTEAFTQLAQAMGSGRLQGDELRSLMERMPQIGNAIVKVFNDIATSKGLEQITKDRANVLVQEVKDGEKKQTQVLKDEMRARQELAERETDAMLKEVGRRYDEIIRTLERSFEDRDEEETKAIDNRLKIQREGIDKEYELERKNIDRIYEDKFDALQKDHALNEESRKQLTRDLEDERSAELDSLDKRQRARLDGLEETAREESKQRARASEDEKRQQEQALRDQQQAEEDSLRQGLEERQRIMEADLEKTIEKNKQANEQMIATILARVKVTQGDLKQMGADGLITTDIMIKAMKELEKLQPPKATALQEFNTAIKDLSVNVGDNLLPALTPLIKGLTSTVEVFGKLPEPVQTATVGIVAFGVAISALQFVGVLGSWGQLIRLIGKLGGVLGAARLAAIFAGWAGAVGPAVGAITTALGGLLAWMAGTFVPAMVAFFSGPVGWIALGVAALIAGIVLFREPIMKFLESAFSLIAGFWDSVIDYIYKEKIKPWVDLWNEHLKKPVTDFVENLKTMLKGAWDSIIKWGNENFAKRWGDLWQNIQKTTEGVKNTVGRWFDDLYSGIVNTWKKIPATIQTIWDNVTSGMSRTWQNMMNGVRNMLNDVIGVWNGIASKTRGLPGFAQLPSIPLIPQPQAFATGGFVSGPTLGLIGEGHNPREYIIPEGSMDAAAAGWQAGLRGNRLVSAWQSPGLAPGRATTSAAMASGPVQINITGGTVQMPDGTQMVTLDQVEAIATAITRAAAPNIVRASIQATGQVMAGAAGRSRYGLS